MLATTEGLCTATKRFWRSAVWATVAAAVLPIGSAAWAQTAGSPNAPALRLINIIPIVGTAGNRATKMYSFDISWVDPVNGLYFLADRSNAALDVVDTTGAFTGGKPDTLFGQIGGSALGFQGDTGNTATSGPNGVTSFAPCIFAGDGNSRVVSINENVSFVAPVTSLSTGGQKRADEMAYDPADGLLLAINNADTPPFGTLITVNKSTCALSNPIKILFTSANGVNATNGAEQPVWDPTTGRFYVSIPEINGPGDGTGPNGGVARITTAGKIETVYPINFMQPAGLTLGPNGDLLVGSNSVFDTAGKKCSAVVPGSTTSKVGVPATCTGIAFPQEAICNPGRGCSPSMGSLVSVPGVGGGDEVFFNSGDGNYYATAGNDPVGPVFGVIASGATTTTTPNTLTQLVPTLPPVPAVTTGAGQHSSGTVHSVAASSSNNHIYVPLPANTSYGVLPDGTIIPCTQGCIGVFSAQ